MKSVGSEYFKRTQMARRTYEHQTVERLGSDHPLGSRDGTAGGLFIPEAAKEKPAEGVVESIGPGAFEEEKYDRKKESGKKKDRKYIPTTVKPGDHVLYEKYAGQKFTIGNRELVLVRERSILGLLPEKKSQPLQIPAATSPAASTALMPHAPAALPMEKKPVAERATPVEKTATAKTTKKAAPSKGKKK